MITYLDVMRGSITNDEHTVMANLCTTRQHLARMWMHDPERERKQKYLMDGIINGWEPLCDAVFRHDSYDDRYVMIIQPLRDTLRGGVFAVPLFRIVRQRNGDYAPDCGLMKRPFPTIQDAVNFGSTCWKDIITGRLVM